MNNVTPLRVYFILPFFLLVSSSLMGQVHTPRYNTPINSNVNGFYEYLPQGYDGSNGSYPLIVFLHGKGALGTGDAATLPRVLNDGLAKLINDGKFPVSFAVNGSTHKFIVISPQFIAWQAPSDVEAVINYAVSHYRVNVNRVYITGLSMGGGGAWDYAGDNSIYANRLAAIVPVCGSSYPEEAKGRVMATANLPVWATHNSGDDVVAVYKTHGYIDYINQAPAPVPAARKTIFDVIGHNAWTKTYDPLFKENGMNIYEWMLQYQRTKLTASSNSPVCPDSVLRLSAWNVVGATYRWSGPNGFTSALREPVITPVTSAMAGTYTVTLTKGDSTATAYTSVVVTTPGLFYKDGDQDGYGSLSVTVNACRAPRGYVARSGDCNDAKSSVYPGAPELCDGFDNNCNGQVDEGLAINRYYLDSDRDGYGKAGTYKDSCAQPVGYATTNTDCNDSKASVFPGALEIIDGLDNDCNGKTDDNAVAGIKVNLYGGTNPYTAPDWNNWNVTASLSSGSFKYADATASLVSATLSSNSGVTDNGTTYGSGMAPAEVLRYTSSSSTGRTLNISGLSAGKTYNLELYATRNANSGYTSVFTIGAASVTVSTYRNLTNKAIFVKLAPNTSGQIVVTITNTHAYSYLTGFQLTENIPATDTTLAGVYTDIEKQTEVLLTEVANAQAANPDLVAPFTLENNNLKLVPTSSWVSGFFPGILWNHYAYTGKPIWADRARSFTAKLAQEQYNASSHDIGFKIYNSYGAGYRLTNDPGYREVIIQAAKTLATRFNATVGCIRSWDWNTSVWQYPVIIDNMMNLELLFAATRLTGDSSFYKIAASHANTTLKNHFRADNSSYHVVDYDVLTGAVRKRMTFQGYSDESAWARGQAWGLYGFTMCYRETRNKAYLELAEKIAAYLLQHRKMPGDKVPYWDFDAPGIPNEPRDASTAAVIASGLYELLKFSPVNAQLYRQAADNILKSLKEHYRSAPGQNKGFLLLHSTGSKPSNSEVDTPIIYADYYYLEALLRSRDLTAELGSPANKFPAASAGSDQTISIPANQVTLNGSGTDSDGSIRSYSWCKISGPTRFTFNSETVPAPVISDLVEGIYTFRLTVTDNNEAIASDDVRITVNAAPINKPPTASAGSDKTITLPTNSTTLSGSGSDADGTVTSYAWSQVSGPNTASLTNATLASATASNLVQGTYTFRLTVTDNGGAAAFDEVMVTVNPVPLTGDKYIKVNLYGGSNPYNNTEWNNWNVKSSLNSGVLKYSNAVMSTISAAVTKNAIGDNGSTYGGTMAPAAVLRYASYATVARTLTLSGLSTSKTYNLELYASRALTGNSTVFTIGTVSVTVLTDNNKSTKAAFTGLKANTSGQLIVNVKNLNKYNFLNGFILTEVTTTATTRSVKADQGAVQELTKGELQVMAFPNPTRHYVSLMLMSNSNKPMQLRMVDAVGRVIEVRQGIAANSTLPIGHNYKPGVYYAEVLQEGKRATVTLMKQTP